MTLASPLRRFLAAASLTAITGLPAWAQDASPVVLELFTSQGCSSCPPADALLIELSTRPELLPLSLNVDYWDYNGWPDTLARPEHTLRQKAYQERKGKMEIYTPQLVVDGLAEMPGGNREKVEAAIAERRTTAAERPTIQARLDGESIYITVTADPRDKAHKATVYFIRKLSSVSVEVGGGENTGKSMTYINVVREMGPVGVWDGKELNITVPRHDAMAKPHDGYAVLLQEDGEGEILAATSLSEPVASN
jgi:hypothetical protein